MSKYNDHAGQNREEYGPDADLRGARNTELQPLTDSALQLIPWLEKHIRFPDPKPPTVKNLAFRDVIDYFVHKYPADPALSHGALLRIKCPQGYIVYQIFMSAQQQILTDENGRPYGRRLIAKKMDAELRAQFQQTDLILFS